MKFLLFFFVGLVLFSNAYAELAISLDKPSYNYDDAIRVSGKVDYQEGMFVIIQIRSPSDIVAINQIFPSPSGSFSAVFEAQGPKWKESGTYTALVTYSGQKIEKTFQYSNKPLTEKPQESKKEPPVQQPVQKPKPTISIKDFPDPNISPHQYYDRYNTDLEYRRWFDSTFTGYSIQDIVGYTPTHIPDFPDPKHSPQYYIDRYNKEERFRLWFELQFPQKTIYDIVGVKESVKAAIPEWIKKYAQLWSDNEIDDQRFIDGLSLLIKEKIIQIEGDISTQDNGVSTIPPWFKKTADWYGRNMISDEDFLSGIQYLIERRIIIV